MSLMSGLMSPCAVGNLLGIIHSFVVKAMTNYLSTRTMPLAHSGLISFLFFRASASAFSISFPSETDFSSCCVLSTMEST